MQEEIGDRLLAGDRRLALQSRSGNSLWSRKVMLPSVVMPPASAAAEPLVKSSTQRGSPVAPAGCVEVDVRVNRARQQQLAACVDLLRRLQVAADLDDDSASNADICLHLPTAVDDSPTSNDQIKLRHRAVPSPHLVATRLDTVDSYVSYALLY